MRKWTEVPVSPRIFFCSQQPGADQAKTPLAQSDSLYWDQPGLFIRANWSIILV